MMNAGGFEARQAAFFTVALTFSAAGIVLFTASGDAYASKQAQHAGVPEGESVTGVPHAGLSDQSGELESLSE